MKGLSDEHPTVIFDADEEEDGKELETQVDELIKKGHTVLVSFPGQEGTYPVVAYDAANKAWITRHQMRQTLPATQSIATAIEPIVGG